MKIFEVQDLRISSLIIIADDLHHATHILHRALLDGLKHWPAAEYSIGEAVRIPSKQTSTLRTWAELHQAGIAHRCNDGGWELISPRDETAD